MTPTQSLTGNDRCDRCGAQAYMKTSHLGGPLLWCRHHFLEHEDALTPLLIVYTQPREKEPVST